jgi:hypothetical protein
MMDSSRSSNSQGVIHGSADSDCRFSGGARGEAAGNPWTYLGGASLPVKIGYRVSMTLQHMQSGTSYQIDAL